MANKMADAGFEIQAMRRVEEYDEETGENAGQEMVELELRTPAAERNRSGRMTHATIRVPKDKAPGLFDRVSATFAREAEEAE